MDIVLLGAPGSGKGTLSSHLVEKYNMHHVSAGDLLRDTISEGGPLAPILKRTMAEGKLVDEHMVADMISGHIEKIINSGIIFDGVARTLMQVDLLDKILEKQNRKLAAAIFLIVPDEIIIDRIVGRFSCETCNEIYHEKHKPLIYRNKCNICNQSSFLYRDDDNKTSVIDRLSVFHKNIDQIVSAYEKREILVTIDGNNEIEDVKELIDHFMKKNNE